MNFNVSVVLAIVKKDLLGLLPLVFLCSVIFFLAPAIATLELESVLLEGEFWVALQANFYWVGYFLAMLLMISVLQQDPAASLNHDWLTRPISRIDWLLAKLAFMAVAIVLPVVVGRLLINLGAGLGFGLSISYALGIEKIAIVLTVPMVFAAALLTENLRKLIGFLMLVLLVFLMPAWSVTRVLLVAMGISLTAIPESLMWVQAVVMFAGSVCAIALVYWFLYCRRQRRIALGAFWVMIGIVFISFFPPSWLYDEDRAVALQQYLINGDNNSLDEAVNLAHALACFPAARIGDGYTDVQEEAHLTQAAWISEALYGNGDSPLSLETTVSYREQLLEWYSPAHYPREYSIAWRLDRVRTRAYYSADTLAEDVPLRRSYTALNRFDPVKATETDYWLVPEEHVHKLAADPTTALHIDFDLALLAPTVYELPVDGQHYSFPELGSCKAELVSLNNQIDIECLKRGRRASLISAQLIGMPASRVDNNDRATFTADWIGSLGRSRTELTLSQVSLVDSSSILLVAYNVERMLNRQLVSNGMLGNDQSICPLPEDQSTLAIERSRWSDKSPHNVSSVAVGNGVRIELLDWRVGELKDAPTMLLIPGLGATAHSWDDFAPELAEHYNVLAITRRGMDASSKPDQGYDVATLSADIMGVMDALDIDSAILLGHSIAGEELSYIGVHYPERVQGLIYADAAYDRTGSVSQRARELQMQLPETPPARPSERVSYAAMASYAERIGRRGNIPEGETLATYDINTGRRTFNELYLDAIMMGILPPRYSEIAVPALGLFSMPGSAMSLMETWYDQADPQVQATVNELYEWEVQYKQAQIERFDDEIPDSRAISLSDADHWIFISHPREVLAAIREFVDGLSGNRSHGQVQ